MLRLKQRWQFLRVASEGRKWVAPGMIVQACQQEEVNSGEKFRVGYTVSKKVGGAIDRNRARRRLKAAAERIMPQHARPGYDFVLIGRRKTIDVAFNKLMNDLETALRKLDAYEE